MIQRIEHNNQTFRNRRVKLDGCTFSGCKFIDCELVYAGGDEPAFLDGCYFEGGSSLLEGPAQNTFSFLKSMLVPGSPLRDALIESAPGLYAISENKDSFFKVR